MSAAAIQGASLSTIDRSTYLGGSDIAAVAGVHPYRSALDVWAEKTGAIPPKDFPQDVIERMEAGTEAEPFILRLYSMRRGGLVLEQLGTVQDKRQPWLAATPDGVTRKRDRNVQAKLVGLRQAHRWGEPDDGPDGIPPEVLCQVQWEMRAIRGAGLGTTETTDVAAMLGTELRVYAVPFDPDMVSTLHEIGERFWLDNIVGGKTPDISEGSSETIAALFRECGGTIRDALSVESQLAKNYDTQKGIVAEQKRALEVIANKLRGAIADDAGFEGSWGRATWKPRKGSPDWKGIATELGASQALVEKYRRGSTRTLRVDIREE